MKVGVLALQGAFIEHIHLLEELGVSTFEIRQLKDIEQDFDALILPGGESTVQNKLLRNLGLFEPLRTKILNGLPVMATCAGLILLAEEIENQENNSLKTMPIKVVRNAYGRQLGSFKTLQNINGIGDFNMIFIRAPYIKSIGEDVKVIAKVNERIVAVKYKNQLALSFHPELSNDSSFHKYFLSSLN